MWYKQNKTICSYNLIDNHLYHLEILQEVDITIRNIVETFFIIDELKLWLTSLFYS